MIEKLLGKMVFKDSDRLIRSLQEVEEKQELNYLDLFTSESPTNLAQGIGRHLGNFSRKVDPLPCYLFAVDQWISSYEDIITFDKKFKKFTPYPDKDFKQYLLHKVIICKVVRGDVFSKDLQILKAVNNIKLEAISYPLQQKAKKYLGLEINPYELSSSEFEAIYANVKQLKEGVN